MGCKTNYITDSSPCSQSDHCDYSVPLPASQATTVEFEEYPESPLRNSGTNYAIPRRETTAVMHPSVSVVQEPGGVTPSSGANCGKASRSLAACFPATTVFYGYQPDELSFDLMFSDRWFSYLYDTSVNAGHVGIACYYLEQENSSSTTSGTPPSGTEGQPGYTPGVSGTTTTSSTTICKPCFSFSCAPSKTKMSYSGTDNLTGDPDCPHPTLFGIGTDSNKLVFQYDQLSSTLPDGVTDISFSYDGVTYTDVWDENTLEGIEYVSSQNPFTSGQDPLQDFEIYDLDIGNASGFRVKIQIESIQDETVTPTTYSGVKWKIIELMSPGSGYTLNQVIPLTYDYTKPDNTVVQLTMNLKVTGVAAVPQTNDATGFDALRVGDTINGHEITRTFHTFTQYTDNTTENESKFPYHIVYVDGNGSNFTKNTQYTSDRNHIITAVAGYGIVDRAILIGLYEFLNKSVQYTTASINKNVPDIFNTLVQPEVDFTVTNGKVIGATIVSGGSGWNTLGYEPELVITSPPGIDATSAVIEGAFTNGVLTSVVILNQGNGYISRVYDGSSNALNDPTDPPLIEVEMTPKAYVKNVQLGQTTTIENISYDPERSNKIIALLENAPGGGRGELYQKLRENLDVQDAEYVYEELAAAFDVKLDPDRNRIEEMPQKLYSTKEIDKFREITRVKYEYDYSEVDIDSRLSDLAEQNRQLQIDSVASMADGIEQKQIPEQQVVPEVLVETVQGPLSQLPKASTYTKYMMRQYRADPSNDITLNITLSCEVAQQGCSHVPCTPIPSVGSSSTDAEGTTTTITYSPLQGPLGGGCQDWSATGNMLIFNDLTSSATNVSRAAAAYGNPFDL